MTDIREHQEGFGWKNGSKMLDCGSMETKVVTPAKLLPNLATQIHSLGHTGVEKMVYRFRSIWLNPVFRTNSQGRWKHVQQAKALIQIARKQGIDAWALPGPGGHSSRKVGSCFQRHLEPSLIRLSSLMTQPQRWRKTKVNSWHTYEGGQWTSWQDVKWD